MALNEDLKPTVEEVSMLLRTRTTGSGTELVGLGSDTGPVDITTFTESTRPTAEEVESVIDQAFFAVAPRYEQPVTEDLEGLARHGVALYAAVLIETSFFRETLNQQLVDLWTAAIERAVTGVNEDTTADTDKKFGTLKIGTIHAESPEEIAAIMTAGDVP